MATGPVSLKPPSDIPTSPAEFEGLRLLSAHSLTDGTSFGEALALPTLVFTPAVTALVLPSPPHAFVLFFGQSLELRRNPDESFNRLFHPRVLSRAQTWTDGAFWQYVPQADAEALLPWWVERLNVLYSHAADPTCFSDALGRHDPNAQMAWFLTLERAFADATLILSDPNQADITRLQTTFDLLDKCESLLGYSKSGPGFKELLRRSKAVPRLNSAWQSLPENLERRFRRHTREVFDSVYDDIREHALAHRRTRRGMLIAQGEPAAARPMSMDDYVSRLVREIRNSATGCLVSSAAIPACSSRRTMATRRCNSQTSRSWCCSGSWPMRTHCAAASGGRGANTCRRVSAGTERANAAWRTPGLRSAGDDAVVVR